MSDIFISYNNKDKEKAKLFATLLGQQGWSVFWDKNIPPGKNFDEYIGEQLEAAKCVIVLWSKTSVSSDWVKEEAQRGAARKVLVPVFIEQVAPPLGFGRIEAAELIDWDGDTAEVEFQNLLHAITLLLPEGERAQKPSLPSAVPEPKIAKKPDKESKSSSQRTLPRLTKTHIISGLAGLILLVALAAAWQVWRNSQPSFGVVFGSDVDLDSARAQINQYTPKPFAKTRIYFREGKYRSVVLAHNEDEAESYYGIAKNLRYGTESIKTMDTWCVNPKQGDGYWTCQNTQ